MRCLAIVQWHHFSYLVISTALLGFGASGTLLTFVGARLRRRFTSWSLGLTLLFAVSVPLSFRAAQALPLDVQYVFYSWRHAGIMALYHLLFLIPFLIGATVIGLALVHCQERVHRVYAANLLGSGAGGLLMVGLMFLMPATHLIVAAAVLGLVAAAAWLGCMERGRERRFCVAAFCAATAVVGLNLARPPTLKIDQYKMLATLRRWEQGSDATDVATRDGPRGRIDVYASPRLHRTMFAGLNTRSLPPEQLMLLVDAQPAGIIFRIDSPEDADILDDTPMSVAYRISQQPRVLLLGEIGGTNVWLARRFGADRITIVQRNPQITELMQEDLKALSGAILSGPGVAVVTQEPRLFIQQAAGRYDVIQLVGAESMAAGVSGLMSLHEDFLLTREGFASCLNMLTEDGIITVTRGLQTPPRDNIKIFATAVAALESLGVSEPGRHLVLLRNYLAAGTLVFRSPLTPETCERLRSVCARMRLDIEWMPFGWEGAEAFSEMPGPKGFTGSYLRYAAREILSPRREEFFTGWAYNVRPANDDSPYFFDFFRWRSVGLLMRVFGRHWLQRMELGYAVAVFALLEVLIVAGMLTIVPLWWVRGQCRGPGRLGTACYFACLGVAFMMIEMVFILKITHFMGDPIYAAGGMLTAFLVFSGLGSRLSARAFASRRRAAAAAVAAIVALTLAYLVLLDRAVMAFAGWPTALRFALSIGLIAPLAFFMGWPFPAGLSILQQGAPKLVPWAWGVNGFASVAGAPLGLLLSMSFGFSRVLTLGALIYAASGVAVFLLPGRDHARPAEGAIRSVPATVG